jgi:guanylate kinase
MGYKGSVLMLVAPSGAGKSSLVKALLEKDSAIQLSISCTTRLPRPGEENGREYHFLSKDEFLKRKEAGDFLEWAEVHGNYYGTSKSWIENQIQSGKDILLEIDWQGARQIQKMISDTIWIFVLPPSIQALEERLRKRGQDDEKTILSRVSAAKEELSHAGEADYLIVNDLFETALSDLHQIISSSRLRSGLQLSKHQMLASQLGIK